MNVGLLKIELEMSGKESISDVLRRLGPQYLLRTSVEAALINSLDIGYFHLAK